MSIDKHLGYIAGSSFASSFKVSVGKPLDDRSIIKDVSGLTSSEIWGEGADKRVPYIGMQVTVLSTIETYLLESFGEGGNSTTPNKFLWKKIATGDGLTWNDFPTTKTTEQGGETTT